MSQGQSQARTERADPTPFRFHKDLMAGRGREGFEMVVARYDEDISWSDAYADWRTVYNKGADDLEGVENVVTLENKGHLVGTVLHHIITRYDTLASITFFCHGSKNYRSDQIIRDEGRCHRRVRDFIGLKDEGGVVSIETEFDIPRGDDIFGSCEERFGDVYEKVFGCEYRGMKSWGKGSWIAVGREAIRRRGKDVYERMLEWVLEGGSLLEYRHRDFYIERMLVHAFSGV